MKIINNKEMYENLTLDMPTIIMYSEFFLLTLCGVKIFLRFKFFFFLKINYYVLSSKSLTEYFQDEFEIYVFVVVNL